MPPATRGASPATPEHYSGRSWPSPGPSDHRAAVSGAPGPVFPPESLGTLPGAGVDSGIRKRVQNDKHSHHFFVFIVSFIYLFSTVPSPFP